MPHRALDLTRSKQGTLPPNFARFPFLSREKFPIGNIRSETRSSRQKFTAREVFLDRAPLYDLMSTVYYPEIDNTLAMKIGGEANPDRVFTKEFEAFARDAGLAPAGVRRREAELADQVRSQTGEVDQPDETAARLAALIAKRCVRHTDGAR